MARRYLSVAAGKFAVVLGHRVPIAGGNLGRVGIADGAAAAFIELAAQLQFERVHGTDELLVHLLDEGGIPGETLGIEAAHLLDQRLQLLARLGTILHYGAYLIEKVQSLVDLALRIGRIGTLLGRDGLTGDVSIAGVIGAKPIAIAIAAATGRIAYRTGDAVTHRPPLSSAVLTTLTVLAGLASGALAALLSATLSALTGLSALLARLARLPGLTVLGLLLAGLTGSPVAGELATLVLLAPGLAATLRLPTGSSLRRLRAGPSAEAGELIAQAR
jgi:hypothetical protein